MNRTAVCLLVGLIILIIGSGLFIAASSSYAVVQAQNMGTCNNSDPLTAGLFGYCNFDGCVRVHNIVPEQFLSQALWISWCILWIFGLVITGLAFREWYHLGEHAKLFSMMALLINLLVMSFLIAAAIYFSMSLSGNFFGIVCQYTNAYTVMLSGTIIALLMHVFIMMILGFALCGALSFGFQRSEKRTHTYILPAHEKY